MPYGDLRRQVAQRFADFQDFSLHQLTIEEREEYEPLVDLGLVVYAGIDYRQILSKAEQAADVIVWVGGNNDTPFLNPTSTWWSLTPYGRDTSFYISPGSDLPPWIIPELKLELGLSQPRDPGGA